MNEATGSIKYFSGRFCGVVVFSLLVLFAGCDRNSTTQNKVSFEGRVWVGHLDATTKAVVIDNLVQGAVVTCENYPGSAKTGSDGSFSLTIQAVRGFSGINSDTYTLQASYNGYDETMTGYGKPGDTIKVKDFVVYQHSTSAPRRVYE